ncbi:MAG: 4-hydroxy-2-oxovalerate aldolase [Gammaproteobacteria bacterium]|nr:4-hydroxy-2-oxovalerate aldolase [Gammaproteobacteria bacterium]
MSTSQLKVKVHDMCLRDGMHPKQHQISLEQMHSIATGLDEAGVDYIEVTHGDGLGGASINYGFPAFSDEQYLRHVIPALKNTKVSVLLIPGIGTVEDLQIAYECGIHTVRVATLCTEADVSEQHIKRAQELKLDTVGFLMMAHMIDPAGLAEQGKKMEGYGANCIYCTDSAGYMLPEDVTASISALRRVLRPETEIGFHGHHNLALGVTNSIVAVQAGATRIDGSAAGLGAGAGNTPLEAFVAVCKRMQIATNVDLYKIMDVAEERVLPIMDRQIRLDRDSLLIGYTGVYSTFLLFAQRAAAKYGVSSRDILAEMGRRKTVGGQEDLIEEVALELQQAQRNLVDA